MNLPPRDARGQLQSGLTRVFDAIPEQHVRSAMRTPLRRVVLDGVFRTAPRYLRDTRAGEVARSIVCHVTGRPDGTYDVYWLEFADGRWQTGRGPGPSEPELTITVDGAELLHMASGRTSPLKAYLSGRLRASGNPAVAARLAALLRGSGSASDARSAAP